MKKLLGKPRKMYNTDTASIVGMRRGGSGESKFKEILYQTTRGDYFIHGNGGELTKWARGENLVEISGEALKYWLRQTGVTQ